MVECLWDSMVPSPYSPELTGLRLTFMGLTGSNSGLFRAPGFLVSLGGKRGMVGGKKEGKEGKRE